jgi:hypothetical protein
MTHTDIAWDLIGHEGAVRIVGGRQVYEAVVYCDHTSGVQVKLSRLEAQSDGTLRQINRYIDPDTILEVLS